VKRSNVSSVGHCSTISRRSSTPVMSLLINRLMRITIVGSCLLCNRACNNHQRENHLSAGQLHQTGFHRLWALFSSKKLLYWSKNKTQLRRNSNNILRTKITLWRRLQMMRSGLRSSSIRCSSQHFKTSDGTCSLNTISKKTYYKLFARSNRMLLLSLTRHRQASQLMRYQWCNKKLQMPQN